MPIFSHFEFTTEFNQQQIWVFILSVSQMSCFLKMTLLIWFFSTVWNSFQECKWKIKHFSFFKHSYLRIPILLNLTNYFHHFNDFPSTEACFLEVTTGSSHKTWKIKKSSFGNFNMHCWQSVTIVTKQSFSIPFFSVKWLSFMTPMTQLIFPYKLRQFTGF